MEARVIASTRHLKFNDSFEIDDIQILPPKNETELDRFINKSSFWISTGLLFKQRLINQPFFYTKFTADNQQLLLSEAGRQQLAFQYILDFLWFAKDCSCHLYLVGGDISNGDDFLSGGGRIRYNAKGERSEVSFSKADFELAKTAMSAITSLMKVNEEKLTENLILEDGIATFDRKLEYVDIEQPNRIIIFLKNARSTDVLPEKISNYILILECLFVKGKGHEITQKVAERVAFYMHHGFNDRLDTFNFIKKCYDIRSSYVHGDTVQSSYQINKGEQKKSLSEISVRLDSLVRTILMNSYTIDKSNFYNNPDIDIWFNKLVFGFDFSQTPLLGAE